MKIQITLTGQDLIELIEQKISNEVSKHGHPGSFDTKIIFRCEQDMMVPLQECLLQHYEVVAVAKPKTAQAPK